MASWVGRWKIMYDLYINKGLLINSFCHLKKIKMEYIHIIHQFLANWQGTFFLEKACGKSYRDELKFLGKICQVGQNWPIQKLVGLIWNDKKMNCQCVETHLLCGAVDPYQWEETESKAYCSWAMAKVKLALHGLKWTIFISQNGSKRKWNSFVQSIYLVQSLHI